MNLGALPAPQRALDGRILQVAWTQNQTYQNGTTIIPADDTIPQSNEGTQFMSLTLTPLSAASLLLIYVNAFLCPLTGAAARATGALFKDNDPNAFYAYDMYIEVNGAYRPWVARTSLQPKSTAPMTIKFRAGAHAAGTMYFNGTSVTNAYGGVSTSVMRVIEIAQ